MNRPPLATDSDRHSAPVTRILALDPGSRRTGVAVSDDLGLYAHARPAIVARSRAELIAEVIRRVREEGAEVLVVGLPLSLSGSATAQTADARAVAAELRSVTALPVEEVDERLSSREAEHFVRGRVARRSGAQDSAAAAIILQAFLDRRRRAAR